MNNDLKNSLLSLGWSDALIKAASDVSEKVEESSIESVSVDFSQISSSGTIDHHDIKILPESVNTFVNFSLKI